LSEGASTVDLFPIHRIEPSMKPISKRRVLAALSGTGCRKLSEHGKHEKWSCPPSRGQHVTSLPGHDKSQPECFGT
jgi:hypothetical protein